MDAETKVQVRFFTRQAKYAVTDAPLFVPTSLRRHGLSDIVNHLRGAGSEGVETIPFEFLLDGSFLRGSLQSYLEEAGLSTEATLELEYVVTAGAPEERESYPVEEWISTVSIDKGSVICGSFDGSIRLWDRSAKGKGKPRTVLTEAHDGPVHAIALADQSVGFLSGGQDTKVKGWSIEGDCLFQGVGHTGAVQDLALRVDGDYVASASWDGSLKLWSVDPSEDAVESDQSVLEAGDGKRRKRQAPTVRIKRARDTLLGHHGTVASCAFDPRQHNMLYSGGWDHTLRSWDVLTGEQTSIWTSNSVINALATSPKATSSLLASGHPDGVLRLWDPRMQGDRVVTYSVKAHKSFISQIAWSPSSPYLLATASYDGSVRVIDSRSTVPLFTVSTPPSVQGQEPDKVFSVAWHNDDLVVGGQEGLVRFYSTQSF